ncbi:MAG: hypothetical protein COA96_09025 [SAR86 cluster bacterium]|uniref:DUF3014 domain-containing protein n=1 Tax=SAR86 cluster bacterium TaxID=2030880 RepID=A0A2A5AZL3_9GAMM|nr:MAG: hypothetical protein COA96_09025 [SAR86 cluster bacterium]
MAKAGLWAVCGVAVFTLLYLVYLAFNFEAPEGTTTVIVPMRSAPAPAEPAPNIRPSLPQTRVLPEPEPAAVAVEEVIIEPAPVEIQLPEPEDAAVVQLPSLNNSDAFVFEGIRAFQNSAALISVLATEQLVRKFVVFVDNISRGEFPQTGLPYRRIDQEMPASNIDDRLFVMDESAHTRFDQVIDTFVSIDTNQAISLYRLLSPLFQQAYAEIGNRNVNFDDTLRSAINNVLRSSNMEGPYQLVKPSVMFVFADASIENLQDVHKQLIRIGPDNTEKLKAKLRQFSMQL